MSFSCEDSKSIAYVQKVIIPLSILTGLSCSIPLPFLDDMVGTFLRCQMISRIVQHHDYKLNRVEINDLAKMNEPGCLVSCLSIVFVTPLKFLLSLILRFFRKIFFFLEIKRAVDLTSRVLVYGFLLDWILKGKMWEHGGVITARMLSKIIHDSCSKVGTKPLEKIISSAFFQGKKTLLQVSMLLQSKVLKIAHHFKKEKVRKAIEEIEPEEEKLLESMGRKIFEDMAKLHETYFNRLQETFLDEFEKKVVQRHQEKSHSS